METAKSGKVIASAAAFLLSGGLVSTGSFLSVMSAFMPDGVLQTADYFDGGNSAVYQAITEVSAPFYEDLEEEMGQWREAIIEEHTTTYPITNDNGVTINVTNTPTVTRRINYVPESLIIAYLMQTDGINTQTAVIDEDRTEEFLNNICTITETCESEMQYTVENQILSEDEIAELYFDSELEKSTFLVMCDAYADYFDVAETKVILDDGESYTDSIFANVLLEVPLYLQYDVQWASVSYGDGTIKRNGCCPTCLAMVFSYYCGEDIYPDDVAVWAGSRYYVSGSGTSWNIFAPAASEWNLTCTNIGKDEQEMVEALTEGKLIIASMGPGTFTQTGHFIVLTGITQEGKITVNDPNDNGTKQHINQEFDVSLIIREAKNMWVFER